MRRKPKRSTPGPALIADLSAAADAEAVSEAPQIVVANPAPAPRIEAPCEMLKPHRISNRAYQRYLRRQQRVLMNPRHR